MCTRAFHARCYENRAKCSGENYNRDASSNSKLEQCFRAHSGHGACLGSNFECTVATQHHVAQRSGYRPHTLQYVSKIFWTRLDAHAPGLGAAPLQVFRRVWTCLDAHGRSPRPGTRVSKIRYVSKRVQTCPKYLCLNVSKRG